MNLFSKLQQRAAEGKPLRVGMIGAGKFGSMYLSQVPRTPGIHLVGIADLSPSRAKAALLNVGWKAEAFSATSLEQAAKLGNTAVIDDNMALIESPFVDIIIDSTGQPGRGHCPCAGVLQVQEAHRDGECGSRCAGRARC